MSKKNCAREFTTITETQLIDGEVFTIGKIYNRGGIPVSVRVIKTQGAHHER